MNDKEKEHRLSSGNGTNKATDSKAKAKNMGLCMRCNKELLVFNKEYYKDTGFIKGQDEHHVNEEYSICSHNVCD